MGNKMKMSDDSRTYHTIADELERGEISDMNDVLFISEIQIWAEVKAHYN